MKAFIAGASGYTGRALVSVLRNAGHEVIAHIRPESSELARLKPAFEAAGARIDTTPWTQEAMATTMREQSPQIVFSLLGTTRARMKKGIARGESAGANSYEHVDYGLTKVLLDATRQGAPSARFVYLSSLGASETTGNEYLRVRGRIERLLREGAVDHWTSVRPSFITGEDRHESRPAERLGATVADGVLAMLGTFGLKRLRDQYASMTGAELAEALRRVAIDAAYDRRIIETAELRRAS